MPDESAVSRSTSAEYSAMCVRPAANGSEKGPRKMLSAASVSGLLWVPSTLATEWQKKHVTPWSWSGTWSRFKPSVVAPSWSAIGAWHLTQNEAELSGKSLALSSLIHGNEAEVLGRVGMHASGPLRILVGVAALARLRVEKLIPRQQRGVKRRNSSRLRARARPAKRILP